VQNSTLTPRWPLAVFISIQMIGSTAFAASPKEAVIYSFQGGSDGSYPQATLLAGRAGNLYGTTYIGGGGTCQGGCGTVFQLTPPAAPGGEWTETVLYRFMGGSDGALPIGGLIFDGAGNLYGTTLFGGGGKCSDGCGTVFELSPPSAAGGAWTETILYSFEGVRERDGNGPYGGVVFDKSGNLYGTTYAGGVACSDSGPWGCGTVFQLSPPATAGNAWAETVIYRFDPSFYGGPASGLLIDGHGNLYGTAVNDGFFGEGTAYKLTQATSGAWSRTILHNFGNNSDGGYVYAGLTFGKGGVLYGATTGYGGEVGDGGTVFQLTPPTVAGAGWSETLPYVFHSKNGSSEGPYGALLASPSGALFGMTNSGGSGTCQVNGWLGCGMVFKLTPPATAGGAWAETTLHSFTGGADGAVPYSGLIFGLGGALYGTTYAGGSGLCSQTGLAGCGTVVAIIP